MSESRESRRQRSRMLAAFFAAGAVLSIVAILVPGWEQMHRAGIAVTVAMAATGAAVLAVLGRHVGRLACHGFTALGTVLIGACQVLAGGGSATATYGMLYIWVILHGAMFFARGAVAAHLALTTVAHVVALVWLGEVSSMAPAVALTLGTQIAAALVVGSLVARIRRQADTDSLTGLANRRLLDRSLAWMLAQARRTGTPTWVAVLDLDGFKGFNDEHGHLAGDMLLTQVADAWQRLVRPTDTLARTGGDEFTLVLGGCEIDEAEGVARRMAAAVPRGVACSIGLARWDGSEPAADLVRRADTALYAAKASSAAVVVTATGPALAPA